MEDLRFRASVSRGFADVLPETLEEAEELAASIERAVQYETGRGVADLPVEVNSQGILLERTLQHLLHQATGPARRHEYSRRRPAHQQHRGLLSVGVAVLAADFSTVAASCASIGGPHLVSLFAFPCNTRPAGALFMVR